MQSARKDISVVLLRVNGIEFILVFFEVLAYPAACSLKFFTETLAVACLFDLFKLREHIFARYLRTLDKLSRFLLRSGGLTFRLGSACADLCLRLVLELFVLLAQSCSLLAVALHLHAARFELVYDVLKAAVVGADLFGSAVYDVLGQSQPLGYRKRIRSARRAYRQLVGRLQRFDIELT